MPRCCSPSREGSAFAAIKKDGSVVTWSDPDKGGNSNKVSAALDSSVSHVAVSRRAFAALKEDGSVVTWGNEHDGGNPGEIKGQLTSGVSQCGRERWRLRRH